MKHAVLNKTAWHSLSGLCKLLGYCPKSLIVIADSSDEVIRKLGFINSEYCYEASDDTVI